MRPPRRFAPHTYRYPTEHLILALTVTLVLVVIAVTATATVCGSAVFVALMGLLAYLSTRAQHQTLLERASPVTPETSAGLWEVAQAANVPLGAGPVQMFVVSSGGLNAYTFGLTSPKVVVLTAGLLRALDRDELQFVIGHELGHVALGHTWLNSLVGGLSGIPSPVSAFALLRLAFLWWNRACEHSADRAGLLACGRPEKAVSALLKVGGLAGGRPDDVERALRAYDSDPALLLGEALATHPLIARRIAELRRYIQSREYQRLVQQAQA